MQNETLSAAIRTQLDQLDGAYTFYYRERDGEPIRFSNRGPDFRFRTASIIKVPIALSWFVLERGGALDRRKIAELDREARVEGAGFACALTVRSFPYADALLHMLATSDNLCTNVVIEKIGMERLNQVWREAFGLTDTRLGRKMMQPADRGSGRDNWTISADLEKWYDAIDALPEDDRNELRRLMCYCQDDNLFFRDFETDPDGFYHKTGGLPGVVNDWGFSDGKCFFLITNEVRSKSETRRIFGILGKNLLEN